MISVVVPAYNEAENLPLLASQLGDVLPHGAWELIIVDDGSSDETAEVAKRLHDKNPHIHYVLLSRNFGHQYALKAGLDRARGDCVISMDADLQHPVRLIPELIKHWREGYDIVYTLRADSPDETFFKRLTSRLFYKIFRFLTGLRLPAGSADFRLMSRQATDVIKRLPERTLFLRGLVFWIGFRQKAVPYHPDKRHAGQSSYTLRRMLQFAISGATSFSLKPLRLAVWLGILAAFSGCLFAAYVLYMRLFNGAVISGWASTLCVMLVLGGAQLFILGILGEYIGLIFLETKKRPSYIVKETSIEERKEND